MAFVDNMDVYASWILMLLGIRPSAGQH